MFDYHGIIRKKPGYVFVLLLIALGGIPKVALSASSVTPVTQWLVIGTFHTSDDSEILDFPYLPEIFLAPSPGDSIGGFKWQAITVKDPRVDLQRYDFPVKKYCAAYAFTYILSKKEQKVQLMLDSDAGLAVWVNSAEVWRDIVYVNPWHDARRDHVANVTLHKGWNRLLIKVCELNGGWKSNRRSFSCSIKSETELSFSLDVGQPGKTDYWAFPVNPGSQKNVNTDSLILTDISLRSSENRKGIKAVIALSNFSDFKAEKILCRLIDSSGGKLGEAVVNSLNSHGFMRVDIPVDTMQFAKAFSAGGSKIVIQSGDLSKTYPIHWGLTVKCLCLAAASSGNPDKNIRELGIKTDAAIETYHISLNPYLSYVSDARKGLEAFCANDMKTVAETLKKIQERSLTNIPDLSWKTAFITGQAHIDMNWLWSNNETVKIAQDTFRQVVAFMDEYPDFKYIQSQAALYKAVEKTDPALFERIRHYVKEGRWELGGGMWVEADTNLSGGESLARSFLLAQRFFLDRFGKSTRVGWLPDNFGHISQLPQLLTLAGCGSFYTKRCSPINGSFWWEAPDGSKILCYANKFYNQAITTDITREFDDIAPKGNKIFIPYGVGDHGGGPTRRDIETAQLLNNTPRYPKMEFSTFENFCRSVQKEMNGLTTHRGEMQFTFRGCYTSVAKVKEGNRRCESALYSGEFMSSLDRFMGGAYPAEDLREAWEILLFNQFHDILPGSAIHESNMDAAADQKWVTSHAENARDSALRKIADKVKIPRGQGQPVVAFNLQPRARTSLVEADIFTHSSPATTHLSYWGNPYDGGSIEPVNIGQGNAPTVIVRDPSGKTIPAQVVWGKNFPPGWRSRILFVADNLPAGGYRSYTIDTTRPGDYNTLFSADNGAFETDFFLIKIDMSSGEITSLVDKRTRTEYAKSGLNHLRIYIEDGGANAWNIGRSKRVEDITAVESIKVTERGPVRACIETVKKWGNSKFVQRTYIYRSYPRIDFELDVHWFERFDAAAGAPMLRVIFPVALDNPHFSCHVPFDVVERPADGHDVPAQRWVDISGGDNGIALLNRSKYGHSFENGELRLSLLRSFNTPDIYPDQGIHHIQYALFPHKGDWKNGVWDEGDAYNVPSLSIEPPSAALGRGNAFLPEELSFISVNKGNVVLSGLKESENGDEMVARLFEVNGERTPITLTLPSNVLSARRLNLIEQPLDAAEKSVVDGRTISVTMRPHEIVTLGIKVEEVTLK
ncbi:MAG: glycoside hydrolase family 38 C-terminal domain-containing protein [Candidatus Latescibacter sp.]|nr:glycoside hydrolase family 38 C-terminal domain-containing protein [Candidatus Latescibacter sp.]